MSTTREIELPDSTDAWEEVADKADLLERLAADPDQPFADRAQNLLDALEARGYR